MLANDLGTTLARVCLATLLLSLLLIFEKHFRRREKLEGPDSDSLVMPNRRGSVPDGE